MAPIEQETNIEILREYSILVTRDSQRLKSLVKTLSLKD